MVDPQPDLFAGVAAAQPQLTAGQTEVPTGRHDHLDLQRPQRRRDRRVELGGQPQRQIIAGRLFGMEADGGGGHADRLVRTAAVVVIDPVVDHLLGHLQAPKRWQGGQQLGPQGLVEAFDLAGGGRAADAGEPMGDGVLPADPVEHDLGRAGLAEPAGELAAIVGQHLGRYPMAAQRRGEGGADGPAGGPSDQGGDDTEPGVVVDAADQLELAAVGQPDPANDIQLPQLHRPIPLPTPPVASAAPAAARLHQPVADQDAVDPRPRRHRSNSTLLELMLQPQRPQPGC
jgi:hypothetical protein